MCDATVVGKFADGTEVDAIRTGEGASCAYKFEVADIYKSLAEDGTFDVTVSKTNFDTVEVKQSVGGCNGEANGDDVFLNCSDGFVLDDTGTVCVGA